MQAEPTFERYGGSAPENYERYFVPVISAPIAAELMTHAALQQGQSVLDLACGTGFVARRAAERVGADHVTGVDPNPGMLGVARAVAPAIEWRQGSAEAIPLEDASQDVVLCQMGLQFFPDAARALKEVRRVLKPGGRFVANMPGPMPPVFEVMGRALAQHVRPEMAGFVAAVFRLHDAGQLRDLLETAGFEKVVTLEQMHTLELPPPREFLWQYIRSTPLVDALAVATEEQRAAVERDVVSAWEPYTRDGRLHMDVRVIHVSGGNTQPD